MSEFCRSRQSERYGACDDEASVCGTRRGRHPTPHPARADGFCPDFRRISPVRFSCKIKRLTETL